MRADYSIPNCVTLPQLYFDTLAQWWKHFRKYNLLIPNRTVRIFLHRSFALKKKRNEMKSIQLGFVSVNSMNEKNVDSVS